MKPLSPPLNLQVFRSLHPRMALSENEMKYYHSLEKGYIGEQRFIWLLEKLHGESDILIFHNLVFEVNNSIFQIDTLIISSQNIYLSEVKNYTGDYWLEGNKLCIGSLKITNPVHQLHRSETLFQQLLDQNSLHFQLQSNVIFNNPEFHLYNSTQELPFVFPPQLKRHLQKLNLGSSILSPKHHQLASFLLSIHNDNLERAKLPKYNIHTLKKGIICPWCNSFLNMFSKNKMKCIQCKFIEELDDSVMRSIKEYVLLFPNKPITVTDIIEWCNVFNTRKTVLRILTTKFCSINKGSASHYLFPNGKV
ncbi:nuclease-related domain-containing protein [Evansella sp. AB-rgal1]|uniref:nuclease-related domain-containing protein n=1 Tax=Evansella sp. AB-rgal1 TaxID=3242696 RepID=UPI00359E0153